jgi:hypothetical protein
VNADKGEHRGTPAKRSRCRSGESGCEASGAEEFSSRFGEGGEGRDKMQGPRYTRPALEAEDPSIVPPGKYDLVRYFFLFVLLSVRVCIFVVDCVGSLFSVLN